MSRTSPSHWGFKRLRLQPETKVMQGNYIEFENIVGEPMREAERLGVSTPVLKTMYGILKGLQWKTMEAKGLVVPKWHEESLYG